MKINKATNIENAKSKTFSNRKRHSDEHLSCTEIHVVITVSQKKHKNVSGGHPFAPIWCLLDSFLTFWETVFAKCVSCVGLVTFSSCFARSQTKYGHFLKNRAGLLDLLQNISVIFQP